MTVACVVKAISFRAIRTRLRLPKLFRHGRRKHQSQADFRYGSPRGLLSTFPSAGERSPLFSQPLIFYLPKIAFHTP